MPTVNHPDQTGDLYATVDVQLPRELTPEQRAHFEALKKLEKGTTHSAA
jgi:DnaJ-class molecular chaperone